MVTPTFVNRVVERAKKLITSLQSSFTLILTVFIIIFVAGVFGFKHFENQSYLDSIYWTVITMSTIGYGDFSPITWEGKVFTILFAIVGISAFAVMATNLFEMVVNKRLWRIFGMDRVNWENHVVILGYNETARSVINELEKNYEGRILIVDDKEVPDLPEKVSFIRGNPDKKTVLKRASVKTANCVISCTGDDSRTIMSILLLKTIDPKIQIVAEALSEESVTLMHHQGAKVINSSCFGGRLLASYVYEDAVTSFFEDVSTSAWGNDIFQISAPGKLKGRTIKDALVFLKENYNILLVALRKPEEMMTNPASDVIIEDGDDVLLLCSPDELKVLHA